MGKNLSKDTMLKAIAYSIRKNMPEEE